MELYEKLAERMNFPKTILNKTVRMMRLMLNEHDVEILLSLPATVSDLANQRELTSDEMETKMRELFIKGYVTPAKYINKFADKLPQGSYMLTGNWEPLRSYNAKWVDCPREVHDFWREFDDTVWPDIYKTFIPSTGKPGSRLLPVSMAVKADRNILEFESCIEAVKNAKTLSVTKCSCRTLHKRCNGPLEVCLQLDSVASMAIDRGLGRKIDANEAEAIIRKSEEAGLIHTTGNAKKILIICNCCTCCCLGFTPFDMPKSRPLVLDPTRYLAEINGEACKGCGVCLESCHFGAIAQEDDQSGVPAIDEQRCFGCGLCAMTCPEEAIFLKEIRGEDFVPEELGLPADMSTVG